MPLTTLRLLTTRRHAARRLDETLAAWLTEALDHPVSKAKARKLVMAGAVLLDGRRVAIASLALSAGSRIEARIDRARLFSDATSRDRAFELAANRILFEDEDLIVVDKPPGLPAHPTVDESRDNLFAAITRFLARRDGGMAPYLGIHQRLDRDTSGAALFTKSKRVNAAVARLFSHHEGTKIYQAITVAPDERLLPRMKPEWTIQNYLGRINAVSKRARYGAVPANGDLARTAFRILAKSARGLWIEAIPQTGRTHQIRVHLAEYGIPILGDDLYGAGPSVEAPRLMLHAGQLRFPHPITGREVSVTSPLPADFRNCLRVVEGGGRPRPHPRPPLAH